MHAGCLMFGADRQTCEPVVPETGLLATLTPRGSAQWAYVTQVRMMAMDRGDCSCPYSFMSFDDFTRDMTGSVAPDLTTDDLSILQDFRATNQGPVDDAWRAFRQTTCGE